MKLTLDEKVLIADNHDAILAGIKLMEELVDRHIQRLLSESLDENAGTRLLLLRAKIDGMKGLINEYKQAITKNNKS
jgi:hypothetical protein